MHSAPTAKLPENDSHQQQTSSNKQNVQKPPTTSSGLPLWMWLLFTILFLTAIALGYRLGFKANDTKTSGVHKSLKLETELRNSTMTCERTRAALYRQKRSGNNYSNAEEKKTIEDLEDRADELREMNDDLFKKHRSLAQQQVACDEEVERVRRQIEDAAKPEVDRLTALVQKEEERSKIVQNENVGAQRVLLLQVLNERRARNFQLRRELGMSVPEDRQSYEADLITKYKIAEKADGFPDDVQSISVRSVARRRNASTLLDPKKNGGIENLTIDDAILAITSNWEPFNYDPAVHNKDLFFTPRIGPSSSTIALTASEFSSPASTASNSNNNNDNNDDNDSSPNEKREKTLEKFRPVHFGRTGNPPPVKGILEKTQLATLSIAQMLRIIVRISFCALRKNNPNFTVPFQFNRPADPLDPIVQSASLVIDTPLIRFCHGCPHTIQTKEFKLACDEEAHLVGKLDENENGDSTSLQSNQEHVTSVYGSFDFWRTRSRVRFTPKVIAAADDQMRKRGINGNTTLAIDFKRSSYFEKACKQWEASKSLPLKHYMWLFSRSSSNSKNKNSESESETSSSNSTTASSGLVEVIPSLNETFRQCFPKMDDLQKGVVNIALQRDYIDTVFIAADASDEEFLEFALRNVDFGPLKIVTSYPKSALTDTVEMEIMSQCDSILVNRFREHSQHVTELYLLQNEFKSDGVFFF